MDPNPPNDVGAGAAFAASDGLFALVWLKLGKAADPVDEVGAGLAPKDGVPKEGLEASCWNENGLFVVGAAADCFSVELLAGSPVLLKGAAARGELLLGALELNPKKEPVAAGADAGVGFADIAVDVLAGGVLPTAFDDVVDPAFCWGDGTDLFKFAKENALSLL